MKDYKTKEAFTIARADGKSYRVISEELGISESTCTRWNKELKEEISKLKLERLRELYEEYVSTKRQE